MDKKTALKLAAKFAEEVRDKYDLSKIFLFGSYTRGNYHPESDIDIAVVLKEYDDSLNMQLELMRIRRKIDTRIEPHPFREKEFTELNPIVDEILKYGEEI